MRDPLKKGAAPGRGEPPTNPPPPAHVADRPIAAIVTDLRNEEGDLDYTGSLRIVLDDWQRQADELERWRLAVAEVDTLRTAQRDAALAEVEALRALLRHLYSHLELDLFLLPDSPMRAALDRALADPITDDV